MKIAGRRRRPSGEKAPLPHQLMMSGRVWLLLGLVAVVIWVGLFVFPTTAQFWERTDHETLEWFVGLRTEGRTALAEAVDVLGSEWFVRTLRIGTVLALIFVRRWRHLFAVLLAIILVEGTGELLSQAIGRPRPYVEIIGDWSGPSHPSAPVAALTVTLAAMAFVLFPSGRRRWVFAGVGAVAVLALGTARIYLGTDHPTDVQVAAMYATATTVVLFRLFAPESVFPVSWRRGVKAHLDVSGERGEAIRRAVRDQLGLHVLDIQPFGLEGSGGSTPLRLQVGEEGDPEQYVFAKLYSQTHLRSDRWYKLGRTILYGSLENEVRFTTVRRLVEYEDYVQRLMRDAGVPSAEPFGVVELTPEREYLTVSQFLDGAVELTSADVDDQIIDDALGVVRCMWDAGLAHRDIKPANVMVRNGRVVLIDVAFGTVRPSPWRQAVDLANMMVILALRTDPEHVYERALRQFAPEDIAEAFAATRSVTLPSQSRSSLALLKKEKGIDIVEAFRRLAPPTEPISIQRWSPRRVVVTAVALLVLLLLLGQVVSELTGRGIL